MDIDWVGMELAYSHSGLHVMVKTRVMRSLVQMDLKNVWSRT